MKLRYTIAVLLLSVVAVISAAAEIVRTDAHITGHVIDKKTGEHIAYASVAVKGTTIGVTTDATGHFLIKNIPIGKFTLVASFVGYQPQSIEVTTVRDKTLEVKFELLPQVMDVDEIVVTGSRNAVKRRESATVVNVVPAKLFENTASNTPAEVLNYQPGLRVEYNCSNCGVPQLRINGLEGQYSQILLDSRPIFSSLAAVYGLEQLPAAMIDRVEVIRGGGSALFGSNAIGGVVNIITKEPMRNSAIVSNNTGVYGSGGVDVNTAINGSFVTDDYRAGVHIFGMIRNRSSYDRNDDGFSELPKLNSETIGFRGYYKLSAQSKLTAEYHHIREFRRGGNMLDRPPHEADVAEQLRHGINGGGLKYDFLSPNLKHKVNVYTSMQNIDRDSYFGTEQNLDAYGNTKDLTVVAGGQYTYSADKFLFMPSEVTAGGEYSDNILKDEMLGYNKILGQTSICYGAFVQNEWRNSRLSLLIGARLDKHNKVNKPIFSPRVNVRYTPVQGVALRASFASGYRAPQAYEEDLHVEAVGGKVAIIEIDPNLKPEYSNSVSGSVDLYRRFGQVEGSLLVEGFYTDLKDVFKLVDIGKDSEGNIIRERQNASGARITGVNLETRWSFTPKVSLDAGFTLQNSRYRHPEYWSDNKEVGPEIRMFRSPDNYGYASLNYLPVKRLSASVSCTYTGSMLVQHVAGYVPTDMVHATPAFWDMGAKVSYDFRIKGNIDLQVSAGMKNIFDSFQSDLDRGPMRDSGYIYGPAYPRMVIFGIKLML